jgi:hypothetical protein
MATFSFPEAREKRLKFCEWKQRDFFRASTFKSDPSGIGVFQELAL